MLLTFKEKIKEIINWEKTPKLLLYLLAITMIIDILLTYYLLTSNPRLDEGNWLAREFKNIFGIILGLAIYSIIIIAFLLFVGRFLKYLSQKMKNKKIDFVYNVVWIFCILYILYNQLKAVVHNLYQL